MYTSSPVLFSPNCKKEINKTLADTNRQNNMRSYDISKIKNHPLPTLHDSSPNEVESSFSASSAVTKAVDESTNDIASRNEVEVLYKVETQISPDEQDAEINDEEITKIPSG
ncbi:hypothetical protein CEXT_779951 [Caerostris extrusa]|uniref:Uncharacterized protein n=1 Tax=Caerostris extrusa TaxID=172846 RepID=A0AAV4MV55_CAEEX|nr:hypothetical protein CEXT_779951 [Caerostris extrusa]